MYPSDCHRGQIALVDGSNILCTIARTAGN